MKVTIINPPLVLKGGDITGSGIPWFPMNVAYLASFLREKGIQVNVIDCFGEDPFELTGYKGKYLLQGISLEGIAGRIPSDTDLICIYAGIVTQHNVVLDFIRYLKPKFKAKILIFENSLAVVGYALKALAKDFIEVGASFVVSGEPEQRTYAITEFLQGRHDISLIDGIAYGENSDLIINDKKSFSKPSMNIRNPDVLPFPAFDLFPLKNYWRLGYGHGPTTGKHLPIITSRGCPYGCRFCSVPSTNQRWWRPRSPKNVVDELEAHIKKYGVNEFHLEDLNPTIRSDRMIEISKEIIDRRMDVNWKITSGTKVETLTEESLEWMKRAGCSYISVSPESGSPRVLKLIDKPFNHEYGLRMVRKMHKLGIASQACFVLGFPGETDDDLRLTRKYIKALARAGLDEVALFIITPVPDSGIFKDFKDEDFEYEGLTFSPEWRKDFKKLVGLRKRWYVEFHMYRMFYHPLKFFKTLLNITTRRFQTKTEMAVWRFLKTAI